MIRRLFLLNGVAVIAVVMNHAAGLGFTAMFWWTDRYRAVTPPNYDQLGSLAYYGLLAIKQLTVFSIPAFLLTSGFFVAYAAQGRRGLPGKFVGVRLLNLLVPYLVWSTAAFALEALQHNVHPARIYLQQLLLGQASYAYYYIPAICQLYLLAPLLVRWADGRWQRLLAVTALVQLTVTALDYLHIVRLAAGLPALPLLPLPAWFFARWVFYFSLGVIMGVHLTRLQAWLAQQGQWLAAATGGLALLSLLEPEALLRLAGVEWRGGITVVTGLYALGVVFCWLRYQPAPVSLVGPLYQLGSRAYGIYLLHPLVLLVVTKSIYHLLPGLLGTQALYQSLLVAAAVSLPWLLMTVITRSPARVTFRYLFG